jgi:hypothetical protein
MDAGTRRRVPGPVSALGSSGDPDAGLRHAVLVSIDPEPDARSVAWECDHRPEAVRPGAGARHAGFRVPPAPAPWWQRPTAVGLVAVVLLLAAVLLALTW